MAKSKFYIKVVCMLMEEKKVIECVSKEINEMSVLSHSAHSRGRHWLIVPTHWILCSCERLGIGVKCRNDTCNVMCPPAVQNETLSETFCLDLILRMHIALILIFRRLALKTYDSAQRQAYFENL